MNLPQYVKAGLLGGLIFSSPLAAQNLHGLQNIGSRVVTVVTYDRNDVRSESTGFFVTGKTCLIASRSMLLGADRAEVRLSDETTHKIEIVIAEDVPRDLVCVGVRLSPQKAPQRAEVSSVRASALPLFLLTSFTAEGPRFVPGAVVAVRETESFGTILQVHADVPSDFNGGAVLDSEGNVVAFALRKVLPDARLVFAIPAAAVQQMMLAKNRIKISKWRRANRYLVANVNSEGAGPTDLLLAAVNHLWLADYAAALSLLQKIVTIDPEQRGAWFLAGDCYLALGRNREAAEAYLRTIRLTKPPIAEAYYSLGMAYDRQHLFSEAVEAYQRAVRIKPQLAKAHLRLSNSLDRLGQFTAATRSRDRALRLDPTLSRLKDPN